MAYSRSSGHYKVNSNKGVKFREDTALRKVMATFDTIYGRPAMETTTQGPQGPATAPKPHITASKSHSNSSSSPSNHKVNFSTPSDRESEKEKKQKYLTAKYGQHQMQLIKKRLKIEDWIYEELRKLYKCVNDADDHNSNFDLEDILDLDADDDRWTYSLDKLADVSQPKETIDKFITECLIKAKTL